MHVGAQQQERRDGFFPGGRPGRATADCDDVKAGGQSSESARLLDKIARTCRRMQERQDELQRSLAEREDEIRELKEQQEARVAQAAAAATREFAERLLEVADALDEEIQMPGSDPVKGMEAVRTRLQGAFRMLGIEGFSARPGERYSPECHAIWTTGKATDGVGAGCIISAHQKGYRMRDGFVLREAAVTVAKEMDGKEPNHCLRLRQAGQEEGESRESGRRHSRLRPGDCHRRQRIHPRAAGGGQGQERGHQGRHCRFRGCEQVRGRARFGKKGSAQQGRRPAAEAGRRCGAEGKAAGRRQRRRSAAMSQTIGIDLGTTNSCMCVMEDGDYRVICNREGMQITESLAYLDNNEFLIGRSAENIARFEPGNALHAIKRLIGRRFSEHEVSEMCANREVPYSIIRSERGAAWVKVGGEKLDPTWVSAFILRKFKEDAQKALGREVSGAVITVPAYFTDAQRRETVNAGRIAGFDVRRIIKEPSAAALAFVHGQKVKPVKGRIAVYDLGGGTFDISIIDIVPGESSVNLDVLTVDGNGSLGGVDFDRKIRSYLRGVFIGEHGFDVFSDAISWHRLEGRARAAKEYLTANGSCLVKLPVDKEGRMIEHELTREKMEGIVGTLVDETVEICERALAKAGIDRDELADVFLVGGMTQMPCVRRRVKEFFGRPPRMDIPAQHAVAIGAAMQAAILQGDIKGIDLRDSASRSLGIRIKDGDYEHRMAKVIRKDTPIPAVQTGKFAPVEESQERAVVEVYQGEYDSVEDNRKLGKLDLPGLQDGNTADGIEVDVSFRLNENDMVEVAARHVNTGREVHEKFRLVAGDLSEGEIGRIRTHLQRFCGTRPGTVQDFAGSNEPEQAAPTGSSYALRAAARRDKGDLDGAIADYGKVIAISPSAENYASRASVKRQKGDLDGAIADYGRVIEVDPSAHNYGVRASARSQKGDLDGAIADYDKAIEISPSAPNYEIRADAKSRKGDLAGAMADYDKAIEIDPSAHNYKIRAAAKRKKGEVDSAIADLDRAIEISPSAHNYEIRASAKRQKGDMDGAVADYDRALELALAKK